jgi:uncharacterized membrane protein YoaT (DUF817 family)
MTTTWPYLICRGTTAALALLALGEAVLAGGFLSGHHDLVRVHLYSGVAMIVVAVVQTVAVLFLRRITGSTELVQIGLLVPVLLLAEGALGATHILLLHVPIGVLMVIGTFRMMSWVWRALPEEAWQKGPAKVSGGASGSLPRGAR